MEMAVQSSPDFAKRKPVMDSDSDDEAPLARKRPNGKRASALSSDDEKPLSKKPRVSNAAAKKRRVVESDDDSDDDAPAPQAAVNGLDSDSDSEDEKPLARKRVPAKPTSNGKAASNGKPASNAKPASRGKPAADSESSEDDMPLARGRKPATAPAKTASRRASTKAKPEPGSSSEDEKPLAKRARAAPAKKTDKKPAVKKEKKGDEEGDDKYKWWEQEENADSSVKWTTFHHHGVLFPPPYEPLPKDVKMKYDGKTLTLPPESEEVAGFLAAMLETDHAQDAKFRENFFRDFKAMLAKYPPKEGVKVTSLEKCDFSGMFQYFETQKEKKKAMTKDEKKAIKEAKDKLEEPYLHAMVDGRKEKTGNFRAEPPGLFRGRGEHPRKGTLKHRLRPEDIILNISKDAPPPIPNIPGKWKAIQHDNTVTWLAHWKENVNGQSKYVFLAAGSSWKGQSDRQKFEKARELIKHVDRIRKVYTEDLKSKVMADRQRATALYFIDKLALRAGNEKGEEEADTVGCCSLRYEHITLEPPNKVVLDFLGKDSMRFHQEVEVPPQVFKNIKLFKAEPKTKGDDIFDRLNTSILNKYLNEQMSGLTAKVFRTYNASWTFQDRLKALTPKNGTVAEKIAAYNTANRDVAILCNHQKTVSKGFHESKAKFEDKIRAVKYQRMKLRWQLFSLNPKLKKKRGLAEEESDLDEDFFERHEGELLEKAIEAAGKKFDRENVKLEDEGQSKHPKKVLDERVKEIKAEFKVLIKERKSRKAEPKKGATEEKLQEQIKKLDDRIATLKVQLQDRDNLKDVALSTSKINYIDPRISVAWAKKFDVPLEKLFSRTLREKFPWAEAEADDDWIF
ncbi:hypothetical protein CcaverHIS002_0206050 [Cutaneotrichosporon cavernicola]|uniref:DNA topoisomerase I n=1 Tax=Cutaneotrichosporon cavernicola TaxID=279322 RepID=A0AA48KYC1_9TREE|nr:uncharacterized protein CcaverHIS019_0206010 [Cutaneotrichosporon cavernicola]BEI81445.1 hypothetical protein CcaverHIS002_0206050 [Cutaneotrichosporon cavernicola]BEI89239.1 hypothetical protein CcaverHIS019_0206010 [Cutaneotrichosporon cavernicola]BEI97014.1 hypothetical protein CcaverHIS631_0206030 [Cutaneotrichosporon cavernicola]BEJ04788.1 hypothetical protein CcaverHIS641_0206050 [Cutaneotrichosporon cavernicola]